MHWANKYRAWALTAFATSDGEDNSEISSDIPNTTEVQGCQRDWKG